MKSSLKIFLTLFIAYAFFTNFYVTTNDNSRFSLTAAIVEEHRLEIDSFYKWMENGAPWDPQNYTMVRLFKYIDYAVYNGHVYSDKAPLGSFLAVPVYFLVRFFTSDLSILAYFCSLFVCGLLAAFTGVIVYWMGRYYTNDENLRIIVSFAYGFGTMTFTYATVFFSHVISTFFVYACFYLLYRVKKKDLSANYLYLSGFLAGLSILSDYYMPIIVFFLFLYCLSFDRRGFIKMFIPFTLILCVLPLYNYMIFRNPFTLSYSHLENPVFRQGHSQGFLGVGFIKLEAIIHLLVSPYRGLFFYNPILILSVFLFRRFIRKNKSEAIFIAAISISLIIFNASYYMWYGGYCVGPRHLTAILPFLVLPLYCINLKKMRERQAITVFFLVSVLLNFIYVNSRMYSVKIDFGLFVLPVPVIPETSNALNQLFLMHGVLLPSTTSILIIFYFFALWYKEIQSYLMNKTSYY